jgi:hypothetical protein
MWIVAAQVVLLALGGGLLLWLDFRAVLQKHYDCALRRLASHATAIERYLHQRPAFAAAEARLAHEFAVAEWQRIGGHP